MILNQYLHLFICNSNLYSRNLFKQTYNYDTECSNLPKAKGIEPQQDEMASYIYQFTCKWHSPFLAPNANKQTRNYDTECPNHHPSVSTLTPKELSRSKMKLWAIDTLRKTRFPTKTTKSGNLLVL